MGCALGGFSLGVPVCCCSVLFFPLFFFFFVVYVLGLCVALGVLAFVVLLCFVFSCVFSLVFIVLL